MTRTATPRDRLTNKVCLLMGGGSSAAEGGPSNGQAVALAFAREGAHVVVVDLHLAAAQDTVRQVAAEGLAASAQRADVSRHTDVQAVVQATLAQHGRIDVLYNNVGIEYRGGVVDTPEDAWTACTTST